MFLSSFVYPILYTKLYVISSCMLHLHEIKHYNYTKNYCIYRTLYFMDLVNYFNEEFAYLCQLKR